MSVTIPSRPKLITTCVVMALWGASSNVFAQSEEEQAKEKNIEKIQVLGSNIRVNQDAEALPITTLSAEDIANSGAVTGAELLAELPQQGEVTFNSERVVGGVNDARGDVSSINLRGIGTGNTLTLLNGRRLVLHPGTQAENLVPVTTVNSNTLPVRGIKRLEVLRDGAAAIYGSDAVAGVLNYVLNDDLEGSEINFHYGDTARSDQKTLNLTGATGFYLNDEKTHITLSAGYYDRDFLMASERAFAAETDLREYPGLPEEFVGDSQLQNTSTATAWGEFSASGLGTFHIQPSNLTPADCSQDLGNGLCIDRGSLGADQRFNTNVVRSLTSAVKRFNLYGLLNHEINDDTELFAEFLYYKADAERIREQTANLTAQRFTVAADAFYNPLGDEITVRSYRPLDTGPRNIDVEDYSYRLLAGLRGTWNTWDWESAVLYSKANTLDSANRVHTTLFQKAINSTDQATAYNLFNGANPNDLNGDDSTRNNQSVIDSFMINVERESETELALADFKISNSEFFSMPAGDAGFAAGIEYRYESFFDNRNDFLNGSSPFVDVVGETTNDGSSVVLGSSPTPNSGGSRNVLSLYAELALPLLEGKALAQRLDLQLAARFEDFSDVGSVTKPKIALSWELNDFVHMRASYAEGFTAPGLPQVTAVDVARSNTRSDPVSNVRQGVLEIRNGSDTLVPEESKNVSYGLVIKPTDGLTFTIDWWNIKQEGVVGILNSQTQLLYDALLRSQGSSNPNVIRNDELEVIQVNNDYTNLLPRESGGVDFAVYYNIDTKIGDFKLRFNASKLTKFDQGVDDISAAVIAAQEAGSEAVKYRGDNVNVPGVGELIRQDGLPEWRSTLGLTWNNGPWGAGISSKYVSDFEDTSLNYTDDNDEVINYVVESWRTVDAYVNYRFDKDGFMQGTRITLGAKNLQDKDPPFADETFGFESSVHSARGRYVYLNLSKKF